MTELKTHSFPFSKGRWIGEGKIGFSASSEFLKFYTRWNIASNQKNESEDLLTEATQHVEIVGDQDHIDNRFTFSAIEDGKFIVELENQLIGYISGSGVYDEKKIAWEFRGHPNFEGYEVYEIQDNGDYLFHAEYVSPDQFRSIIDGRIWLKSEKAE